MPSRRFIPSIVWAIIILVLMGLPGNYFPRMVSFWDWLSYDKLIHLFIFGIQVMLLMYGIRIQNLPKEKKLSNAIIIFISVTIFAGVTELLQSYVFIRRHGSIYDFLADVCGIIIGILIYYWLYLKKKKKSN
ncbi:MAG: hypothetical protein CMF58_07430 [Lentimicrobiaceae bacterium]|jgi:VanZ family protein|nr:hypothetical protein [Lentimicrobiaceae bacterium]MDG1900626.1 VanZ family protein [Bacteroidales bacterium]MDG2081361.1 VanZ family protein [Bacteroidales bacterium]|tara:strand:- start:199 stop:594 length:396 start_codon:yes stop_codon:yes gene_type:complete